MILFLFFSKNPSAKNVSLVVFRTTVIGLEPEFLHSSRPPSPGLKIKKKLGNEPSEEANRSFGKSTNNSYIKLKTSSRHTPSERVPETHAKLYCCIMTEIRCLRKTLERSSKVATRNLLPNSFKKVSVSGPQLP